MTSKQGAFVKGLTSGLSQTEAARRAGYAHPAVQAVGLIRNPAVNGAIRAHINQQIRDGAELALGVMKIGIQGGEGIPFKEQRLCAEWWLGACGIGSGSAVATDDLIDKPLGQMTVREIEQLIARNRAEAKAIRHVDGGDGQPVCAESP